MPATAMDADQLEALIRKCLSSFYQRRIAALNSLDLEKVLGRKNPYLFRVNGMRAHRNKANANCEPSLEWSFVL